MAKREIPLFLVDRTRLHKKGECDFLVCSDMESGFIARIDFVQGEKVEVGDDYRIGLPNSGISCRIQVVRYTGHNPAPARTRTLLRAAMEYYEKTSEKLFVDADAPSPEDCAQYIDLLIKANQGSISEGTPTEQRTRAFSLRMLQMAKYYLKEQ